MMITYFPILMKDSGRSKNSNKKNVNKSMLKHIIIKLLKTSDKNKVLKVTRGKQDILHTFEKQ